METPKEDFDPTEEKQEPDVFDTQVEVVECTDYYEYKRYVTKLEKAGYKYMYNVENDLLKQHVNHFKQTRRFRAVALIPVFSDPDANDGHCTIDKTNTAIWYLV